MGINLEGLNGLTLRTLKCCLERSSSPIIDFLSFSANVELQSLAWLPSTPLMSSHSLEEKLSTAFAGTLGPRNTVVLDSLLI